MKLNITIVIHTDSAIVLLNNSELSSFNISPVSSLCVLYHYYHGCMIVYERASGKRGDKKHSVYLEVKVRDTVLHFQE